MAPLDGKYLKKSIVVIFYNSDFCQDETNDNYSNTRTHTFTSAHIHRDVDKAIAIDEIADFS